MNKRITALLLALTVLTSCGLGEEASAKPLLKLGRSGQWTPAEIQDAAEAVLKRFSRVYPDGVLLELEYPGDAENVIAMQQSGRYNQVMSMVLISAFETDSGGKTTGYRWLLQKNHRGAWTVADHGF